MEVLARCQTLAGFSEIAEGICRTFLCDAMHECHREIEGWLAPLAIRSRIDAAGNLCITYPALEADAPRLFIGSHLDTVPNAGAYDGILGVVLAIALLEALEGRRLPFAVEVIGFSEEEGIRFGTPFLGSRALVGSLDEPLLSKKDARGISMRQAIENFGLKSAEIPQAAMGPDVLGYLEVHIEQGPVLESLGHPLGIVEVIVGQSRLEVTFEGHANHAGTTPMNLRRDAVAAAAEWISAVENHAKYTADLMATVGAIQVKPGTGNVIAGEVRLSLDVRHRLDEARMTAVEYLLREAEEIATRRGGGFRWNLLLEQRSTPMNPLLVNEVARAVSQAGCEPYRMVSGAGHDAMIIAAKVPAAMLFLRTPGGVSHDPAETVAVGDIAKAVEAGCHLLEQLAGSAEFLKRIQHA